MMKKQKENVVAGTKHYTVHG